MKVYYNTHKGLKKATNQDCVYADIHQVGNLENILIVADGVGGEKGGGYASKYTVKKFVEYIQLQKKDDYDSNKIVRTILDGINYANSQLRDEAKRIPEYSQMATTLVLATSENDSLYIANVGDSRLYLINNSGIMQVTKDHTYVGELLDKGTITKEEALRHEKRHKITRAIGAFIDPKPDIFEIKLDKDDKILLCSDGLTNMLSDKRIYEIVRDKDLFEAGEALIDEANRNGGYDNISVVLAKDLIS